MDNDLFFKVVNQLNLITQSAENYIDDGSWIDTLSDDIEKAKRLLQFIDENFGYLEPESEK